METDREVMVRVAGQDETAFSVLVERYGGRLLAVARRLLGSRADAEDAVQRALLQCYTGASSYQPRWAVSTWLYRILTNVCVDELRRRATRTAYGGSDAAVDSARSREPRRDLDLHRALARVPREARVLLALRYAEGLSYGELARIRGISVNTVKSQLARGKALLREELGKRGILHD
jgi:RNA polymerase sigma-70 factor (ECF subfamily)